jgi:predicted phage tail protein
MKTIKVYGPLATFLKRRVFRAEVKTAAEAVRFLTVNFPAVEKFIAERDFHVFLGERDLDADEIHDPAGQQVIKIAPVVAGAGSVGRFLKKVVKIIAGAVLVAVGVITGIAPLIYVGASLIIGGVAQLLSPVPKTNGGGSFDSGSSAAADSPTDPRKNYSFSGIQQTSRQGVPINICYGEIITGSIVVSAGIDVAQVSA